MCIPILRLTKTCFRKKEEVLTREKALVLLGVETVPGGNEMSEVMISWLEHLIARKGEDWVVCNRERLINRLKQMGEEN